jgi:cytidylate kinase
MSKRIIVAIDGPAGAGKSTIARRVAARLGYIYIDTGAMYRAVALWALRAHVELSDMHRLGQLAEAARIELGGAGLIILNGEDVTEAIRHPDVSSAASKVAAVPAVRRAMVERQRDIAEAVSVVMEGRDIGTVVFPDAHVKIYLDASVDVRADRRAGDLRSQGLEPDPAELIREIAERDRRDSSRPNSPLMQAPDAVYLDSSALTTEQVEEEILKLVRARTSNGHAVHTSES